MENYGNVSQHFDGCHGYGARHTMGRIYLSKSCNILSIISSWSVFVLFNLPSPAFMKKRCTETMGTDGC